MLKHTRELSVRKPSPCTETTRGIKTTLGKAMYDILPDNWWNSMMHNYRNKVKKQMKLNKLVNTSKEGRYKTSQYKSCT